ncbi:F-box only protein 39-like [Trichomycterus rosablanca]|uniref:F-box only protein 39-like n=1 Tax=Trichomycterus rosablanca TaxID=2290929 RepID=UPI002F35B6CA
MEHTNQPEEHLQDKEKANEKIDGTKEDPQKKTLSHSEEEFKWSVLPDVCLRQVFWWLQDADRAQAALVCHHWHHVVRSPSLWRKRTFNFSGHLPWSHHSELENGIKYVQSYGSYLENLEVHFIHPLNTYVTRRFQQIMRTFLAALRKSGACLRSLTIYSMHLNRPAYCNSVRNALVRSLAFYLRRGGSQLNSLNLTGARFNLPHGIQILEAVAATQHYDRIGRLSGLATLNLKDFFTQSLDVYSTQHFARVLQRFQGLSNLTLNYSCISNELLQALAFCCTGLNGVGGLCNLSVYCHANEPHFQMIRGDAWALLAQKCPNLRVQITVEGILAIEQLCNILLKEIPLNDLTLSSLYLTQLNWTIKPALSNLLPWYRTHLQKLTLDIQNNNESMEEELLELVTVCSKLTYLNVRAFLSISFLETLLQKRLERKCSLQTIKVRLYIRRHETHEANAMLQEVFSRYKQLIDSELTYYAIPYPIP